MHSIWCHDQDCNRCCQKEKIAPEHECQIMVQDKKVNIKKSMCKSVGREPE